MHRPTGRFGAIVCVACDIAAMTKLSVHCFRALTGAVYQTLCRIITIVMLPCYFLVKHNYLSTS